MLGGRNLKQLTKQRLVDRDKRFYFCPFWKLTRFGFIKDLYGLGCDEWHNKSKYLTIPLIGSFTLFDRIRYYRYNDSIHAFAWVNGKLTDGTYYKNCDICQEMQDEINKTYKTRIHSY